MEIINGNQVANEADARDFIFCVGCAKEKGRGPIVCWTCFKGFDAKNPSFVPLKYYGGTFESWQVETWGK